MKRQQQKSESAAYWEKHLASWEASAYFKEGQYNANWWDRLSTVFRGDAMYVRMKTALELLQPHVSGRTVFDVGCASGRFAFQLSQAGAQKVYGADISLEAVEQARAYSAELGAQNKLEFSVMDVIHPEKPLPQVDIVTALGVIEYFDAEDMASFLGNLRTTHILLDFPDQSRKNEFPTWILRQVYIRVNRLPGVYLYSLEEFAKIAEPFGFRNLRVIERNNFYYITNLPE
jgi:cyclopropane fatty-acyl-phospholipid synthase-like methyltransferase